MAFATIPTSLVYANGETVPIYVGNGSRVNVATGAASSAATALSTGARAVVIRCTAWCYLKFGTGTVVATADAGSQLLQPGELVYPVPTGATHFAVIQLSSAGLVQVETLCVG